MRDYPDTIIHLPQTFDTDVFAPSSTATFVLELGPETQRVLASIEHQMARIADAVGRQGAAEPGPPRATYSVKEAAQLLGKSESTVRRWMREGRLGSTKSTDTQQGRHMIPFASLRKYLGSG